MLSEEQRTIALDLVERRTEGESFDIDDIIRECSGVCDPDPIILLLLGLAPAMSFGSNNYCWANDNFVPITSPDSRFVIDGDAMHDALEIFERSHDVRFKPLALDGWTFVSSAVD